jgi:hypothetical protein
MTIHNCVYGSSWFDVCLNTYQTLDHYIKLLNDNGCEPNIPPVSGQQILWDETLVIDSSTLKLTLHNGIIYATLAGVGVPVPPNATIMNYLSTQQQVSYTATATSETVITFTPLQTTGAVIISITKEVKPMKTSDYIANMTAGTITLLNGLELTKGQTLFLIYSIPKPTT